MAEVDLLLDVLKPPISQSGAFRLTQRCVHLTYPLHPPPLEAGGLPDPRWAVEKLRAQLYFHGWGVGEWSACCEKGYSRFFQPPRDGPLTHVAIEIIGREDEIKKFQIVSPALFIIEGIKPEIRAVTHERQWHFIFDTYHRREGGPLAQSGQPRRWTKYQRKKEKNLVSIEDDSAPP